MRRETDFTLRPYKHSDARAVVKVLNAAAQSIHIQRAVVDNVGNVRLIHYVPLTSKKVVVTTTQNKVVGYAYLADKEQHIIYEVGGAVHPDYWKKGIGTQLLTWAEKQAKSISSYAPSGVKTVLQTNLYKSEEDAIQLFVESGYTKIREWMHLAVELDKLPVVPPLPDNFHLREMDLEHDWDIVGSAMEEAFADHWGVISMSFSETVTTEEQMTNADIPEDETYSNTPGLCFLLMDKNHVAGGVLCNAKLVESANMGRVGSLFVRPGYRRQGAGRALMLMAFHAFWQQGVRRIITDTDANSFTGAPTFYTKLGMQEYRRELLFEKEIRPGKEVRRLSR
ncbi:MAG: GNAT family N-acetyltransferase [Anaerolineales bacterium]|nr:GNAT family N-acetyltransferase [Anaerolineales bacterium]